MPKYKDIKKKLIKLGFTYVRTTGSHEMWRHELLKTIPLLIIPKHGGKDLKSGTESKILKQIKEVEDAISNNNTTK